MRVSFWLTTPDREGLKTLLEQMGYYVAGEAGDGFEAVRLAKELQPDVAILDLTMPRINGVTAAKEIRSLLPKTKVILLRMHTDEHYVLDALQAGVNGYVVKTDAAQDLADALKTVLRGSTYRSAKVSRCIGRAIYENKTPSADLLTPRESEILTLIAEGKITKEIALLLGISVKTAEARRAKLMSKIGTHGVAGLARYAVSRGLVEA